MAELLPNWETHNVESFRVFSQIRLIVLDLDGTLIPSNLSTTVQDLASSLSHNRYQVNLTIATGRTLFGVKPLLEKLSLPSHIPLALYNGSLVIRNGNFTIIDRKVVKCESLQRILNVCSGHCVRIFAYFYTDPLFSSQPDQNHEFVMGWAFNCERSLEFNKMPVNWITGEACNAEPCAILIDTSSDPSAAAIIESQLVDSSDVSVTKSGSRYVEIRPRNSNKAAALECIAKDQNLVQSEVLALGDNDNDSEMLAWAGIGVAVANASALAIEHSDYVCRYGVFEGAVEILRLVKHAKHYFRPSRKSKVNKLI